ncbi:homeodomain-interacting protein kinase 2-like [Dicentrarchus labrax]|uniref:homeodomain-interacting protein kinase 2-like n=1 Tax=Dicentrarchus labrax TaxID=13489 RepID=UPI0021F53906|nr:homeodomain-interacting protein kinase 2-like [Dicentrarchus labrax]
MYLYSSSDSSSSSSSDSSRCPSILRAMYPLPSNYKLVSFLGEGGFGDAIKCVKKDTNETVAVKVPHYGCSFKAELTLLNFLMEKNLDKCNIVRFIDLLKLEDERTGLAFELLDENLSNLFFQRNFTPLDLHEVRSVVQQMATALNALKMARVIHSDIKLDNIMVVDRNAQPLTAKLIDFGLAFPASLVKQGAIHQTLPYRAPEIILGLPISEAIDMWSLGVVMAFLVLGNALFPGETEYDTILYIVDLLGIPPEHLLRAGIYSDKYFIKTFSGRWKLKTRKEYWRRGTPRTNYKAYQFHKLDEVEMMPLDNLNKVEPDERKECIDLLKAMLRMDPSERITPGEVLAHPFITRGTVHHSSDSSETLESSTPNTTEPGTIETAEPLTTHAFETKESEPDGSSETLELSTPKTTELAINRTKEPETNQAAEPQTTQATELNKSKAVDGSNGFHESPLYPGVISVQSAPPERCLRWDEDSLEQSEASSLDSLEDLSDSGPVEYSEEVESDLPLLLLLSEDCSIEQEPTELTDTTSEDTDPERRKEKRKRNCFKRSFCWMRRTLCICVSANNDEG